MNELLIILQLEYLLLNEYRPYYWFERFQVQRMHDMRYIIELQHIREYLNTPFILDFHQKTMIVYFMTS